MLEFVRQHRTAVAIAAVIVAIPLLAFAWWLIAPLFFDEEVDEQFPLAAMAVIPSGMAMADAEATMVAASETEERAADGMVEAMGELLAPEALLTGQFRDADSFHTGEGTATIYELGNQERVLRFEDFRVRNGPDLRVLLAKHADPGGRSDVQDIGYIELAPLKGNVGNQNYDIRPDVDLDEFNSVVIYCRPFHVVFAVAPLN